MKHPSADPALHNVRPLSTLLEDLRDGLAGEEVTMRTLVESLHERGFGMILLFFAAPMALPIPVPPGINIMLALPLVVLTAQQALGAHTVWMPQRLLRKTFSVVKLRDMLAHVIPWLKKTEFIFRPRLPWITQGVTAQLFGTMGVIMALTVMIPLPLTNTVPSFGIALMAIGVLMRDGLAMIAGAVAGIVWVAMLAAAIIFFGPDAFEIVKTTIKSFL